MMVGQTRAADLRRIKRDERIVGSLDCIIDNFVHDDQAKKCFNCWANLSYRHPNMLKASRHAGLTIA